MSATRKMDDDRARMLMMAALDGEVSVDERAELEQALDADPALRAEWNRLSKVKEVTKTMGYIEPPEEIWGVYWTSVYNRLERGLAWVLVAFGSAVLICFGAWKATEALLADTGTPLAIRLAVAAVAVGGALLLLSVIREKLHARRSDPYKEVQR